MTPEERSCQPTCGPHCTDGDENVNTETIGTWRSQNCYGTIRFHSTETRNSSAEMPRGGDCFRAVTPMGRIFKRRQSIVRFAQPTDDRAMKARPDPWRRELLDHVADHTSTVRHRGSPRRRPYPGRRVPRERPRLRHRRPSLAVAPAGLDAGHLGTLGLAWQQSAEPQPAGGLGSDGREDGLRFGSKRSTGRSKPRESRL